MKNKIYYILFFCMSAQISFCTPFTILFSNGTKFTVHKVDIVTETMDAWKKNENTLKEMFYKYNYPDYIGEYKGLFYHNTYPAGIEKIYPEWRPKMNSIQIVPQAIFFGMLDSLEVSCIQYYFVEGSNQIQMSFLAKRIEGKWYPVGSTLMAQYQHVMTLLSTLQPGLASCLLKEDPASTFNSAAQDLKTHCMSGAVLSEACIYQAGVDWGTSVNEADLQKEKLLFKNRMIQDVPLSRNATIQNDLRQYVTSLNLPEECNKKVLYYFSKNESMKAISVLRAYGYTGNNASLFADLNRVQQTDQYKTIEAKVTETPKQN